MDGVIVQKQVCGQGSMGDPIFNCESTFLTVKRQDPCPLSATWQVLKATDRTKVVFHNQLSKEL